VTAAPVTDTRDDTPEPVAEPIQFAVPDIDDADVDAVTRVLRSGWLTTGDEALALESELADRLGARHVIAVSSCTAAIELGLRALQLPPGARVGVPTWTFVASALPVAHLGLTPVLLDVDPASLNLSPDALAAALDTSLDGGLDALIPVHFGGAAVDRAVHELCRANDVPVIEDAAHALGASDDRGPVAGRGSVGACFSFYATKNLTSGEGGALATDHDDVAEFARSARLHGLTRDAWARYRPDGPAEYDLVTPGIKANLPDLLATLARSQLARFDALQARRRQLVDRYRAGLATIPGLTVVPPVPVATSADHLMVVLLPQGADRSAVRSDLTAAGIATSVHFQPLHRFDWFREHAAVGPGGLAGADLVADRALSLPLHTRLVDADVDRVVAALADSLAGSGLGPGADREAVG
jgi:dTDP-4-amino-4,6-dideoxygalactose transaminase